MKKVLVCSTSFGYGDRQTNLHRLFARHKLSADFISLTEAQSIIHDYEGLIIGTDKVTADLLQRATRLKAIIKYGAGTDNIDKMSAHDHGVLVLSLPGINREAVAEMAIGLILAASRRIVEGDRAMRTGKWERSLGSSIVGKTLGLVGCGAIGMTVAGMVSGFKMTILAYDVNPAEELLGYGGRYVSLEELLTNADFVSIHIPLTEQTFHLIAIDEFKHMQSSAILVNTARGPVVDEKALYEALIDGEIAGAALDVFEVEPPFGSKILELENVICTPHVAAYAAETLRRMDAECVATLSSALYPNVA